MSGRFRAVLLMLGVAGLCACLVAAEPATSGSNGWGSPQTVAPLSPAASVHSPAVAVDGRGTATAVWTVRTASGSSGAEAEHRAGGTWTRPRTLPGPPEALAVNAHGDKILAWAQQSPVRPPRVAVSYRRSGGGWQPPSFVSTKGDDALYPKVALDARGGALAVWLVYRGPAKDSLIEAAARPARGSWGRPRILSNGVDSPVLAVAPDGGALVVWLQSCVSVASASQCTTGGSGNAVVRIAARSAHGVWSRTRTLSALGEDARFPQVAVNATGTAIVLWQTYSQREQPPPSRGIAVAVGSTSGRLGPAQSIFSGFPNGPSGIALAPTGEAVAVWASGDTVYAAARRPGSRFGAPMTVGTGFSPVVGIDARGNAIAVWTRTDGANLFVHAALRSARGTFDAGVDLAPAGADCTKHLTCNPEATVAVGGNGNAVAIWQLDASPAESFGDSFVQAARYTAPRTS